MTTASAQVLYQASGSYLTTASAESTYLTIADASGLYLTTASAQLLYQASGSYLTTASGAFIYAPLQSPVFTGLVITNDISSNGYLYIQKDSSFNGNVGIVGNLTVNGLTLNNYISVQDTSGTINTSITTSNTTIAFNSILAYSGSFSSSSLNNNTITISTSGNYNINASLNIYGNVTPSTTSFYLYKNSAIQLSSVISGTSSNWSSASLTGIYPLIAGDTIYAQAEVSSGVGSTNNKANLMTLTIMKV